MLKSLLLMAVLAAASTPPIPPSENCRQGALRCQEAVALLEKCKAGAPDGDESACAAEAEEASLTCAESSGICHVDGSRTAP